MELVALHSGISKQPACKLRGAALAFKRGMVVTCNWAEIQGGAAMLKEFKEFALREVQLLEEIRDALVGGGASRPKPPSSPQGA